MIEKPAVKCKISGRDRLAISLQIIVPQNESSAIDWAQRNPNRVLKSLSKAWAKTGYIDFSVVPSEIASMNWDIDINYADIQSFKGLSCLKNLRSLYVERSAIHDLQFGVGWGKKIKTLYIDWLDADIDLSDWLPRQALKFVSLERGAFRGLKSLAGCRIDCLQVDRFNLAYLVKETRPFGYPSVNELSLVHEGSIIDCKSEIRRLAPRVLITYLDDDDVDSVEDAVTCFRRLRQPTLKIVLPWRGDSDIKQADIPIKYRNNIQFR